MGLSQRQLGQDEVVILHLRTHMKALFLSYFIAVVATAALGGFYYVQPESWKPWGMYVALAIYVLTLIVWLVIPFMKWITETYTVTNRRIITRKGIITRTGHDLPLRRVNDVQYERDIIDRVLGCGTLILETAAEAPVRLPDLPNIERVHVQITEILFGSLGPEEVENND